MNGRVIATSVGLVAFATAAIVAQGLQTPASSRDAFGYSVAPGTASIAGALTSDDAPSAPIRRAIVTVTRSDLRFARTGITDDDGRFVVGTLPAGRYVVAAGKPGYVTAYYGSPRADRALAVLIAVPNGQPVTGVNFKMSRGASIAGRVVDESGQPMSLSLSIVPVRTLNGVRSASGESAVSMRSDDRGVYRGSGLAPGDYLVVAFPARAGLNPDVVTADEMRRAENAVRTGRLAPPPPAPSIRPPLAFDFATIYFPGTPDPAGAITVTVAPGEDREGADFVVSRVPVATISGTLVGPDGQAVSSATVTLATANGFETRERSSMIQSGRFVFTGVPPGIHTLSVRTLVTASSGAGNPMWASQDVTVSGRDVTDVALLLSPGLTVSGRVAFDAVGPPFNPGQIRMSLEAEKPPSGTTGRGGGPASLAQISPDATGAFKFVAVPPGRYTLSIMVSPAGPPVAWSLASALIAGQEAGELPVDIRASVSDVLVTVTDKVTTLSGTVRNVSGVPTTEYVLVAFPVDRQYWAKAPRRVRGPVRPDETGRYEIQSLPPGEYFLAALTDFDRAYLADIATLDRIAASSVRVTLRSGESVVKDLQVK